MQKKQTMFLLFGIFILCGISFYLVENSHKEVNSDSRTIKSDQTVKKSKAERIDDAIARKAQMHLMLRDPATDEIPQNIRESEKEFLKNVPKRDRFVLSKSGTAENAQALSWTERGPDNVGGRTRGMDIDINTSGSSTVIIAGGASGGIWKSTNNGDSWTIKTAKSNLHSITTLIQDKRSGKNDIWYAGTGEQIGNSADGGGGAAYLGDGVYKSTNNGDSWSLLSSTSAGDPQTISTDWQYVFNLAIDPSNTTDDEIYAATGGGIFRSTDGGASWGVGAVREATHYEAKTDVVVNSNGVVLVALDSDAGSNIGLARSIDGITFTDVTPFSGTYKRIVLAFGTSDPNYAYAFVERGDGSSGVGHSNELWISTDAGQNWSQQNISSYELSTQGGYNMLLAVSPTNENFVLLGGVVLWRSTDGFATIGNTTRVGGLGSGSGTQWDTNVFGDYLMHHPDNHKAIFHHSNSDICYVANDGGVHITNDITAAATNPNPIIWNPQRDSYNVTQLYALSIAPEANSFYIAAGLQDRGNFTRSSGNSWFTNSGGDGATCEVAPIGDDAVYLSTSEGKLDRYSRADQSFTSSDVIQPSALTNPMFVNPILLDPVNSQNLYYPGGNGSGSGIWRNSDAINATQGNWIFLTPSAITTGQVSALGMSMGDNTTLYYGTSDGKVYSLSDPSGMPSRTDITGGSFPSGYVSSIAVDPSDAQKVMVVFSNYNVSKVWYSSNGGSSWTNVDGNLSAAVSARSAAMFTLSGVTHYFLATSVGLYFTTDVSGTPSWTQEATSSIGNVVCAMLDWRIDTGSLPKSAGNSLSKTNAISGVTLAVGTHGRGVFTTQFTTPLPVELVAFSGLYNTSSIELAWETATELNNYGFEIEKSSDKSSWKNVGFVKGHGNSNSPKYYSFSDEDITGGNKMYYRLKQIDIDGTYEFSSVVEISVILTDYKLSQNYPNPFNPSTKISYTLPETANVKVDVYSITGELVTQLVNLKQNSGNYSVEFNTSDFSSVSSGMYIYRISAKGISGKDFVQTKKMLLLK